MNRTTGMARPGRGRMAAIILLGPLAGALAFAGLPMAFDPPAGGVGEIGQMSLFVILFGYILGIVPSTLAAVSYWAAYPVLQRWPWPMLLLACLAIGAISGAVGVAFTMSMFERQLSVTPGLIAAGAWAGAAALPLTALPFRRRPG